MDGLQLGELHHGGVGVGGDHASHKAQNQVAQYEAHCGGGSVQVMATEGSRRLQIRQTFEEGGILVRVGVSVGDGDKKGDARGKESHVEDHQQPVLRAQTGWRWLLEKAQSVINANLQHHTPPPNHTAPNHLQAGHRLAVVESESSKYRAGDGQTATHQGEPGGNM